MLNTISAYEDCGKRAATAQNQKDQGRYDHERGWFNRAVGLEKEENKKAARDAYDKGYKDNRNVPTPTPFR